MDHLTEAERRYLAFDLPEEFTREVFGGETTAQGCGCTNGTEQRRRMLRATCRPIEIVDLALMIAFYAAAGHGVVQKIAELGTLLAS